MVQKKYIYDLPTRLMHAGIGLTVFLLLLTAGLAHFFYENGQLRHELWDIHILVGNILIVFIASRIAYLFIGPEHSQLKSFLKIKEWKLFIFRLIKEKKWVHVEWSWGHHPLASLAYLSVYVAILLISFTGMFLTRIQFDQGIIPQKFYDDMELLSLFKVPHLWLAWFLLSFTAIHISALIYHRIKDKLPVFESMRTGYQYKHEETGENHEVISTDRTFHHSNEFRDEFSSCERGNFKKL